MINKTIISIATLALALTGMGATDAAGAPVKNRPPQRVKVKMPVPPKRGPGEVRHTPELKL